MGRSAVIAAIGTLVALTTPARALVGDTDGPIGIDGSLRSVGAVLRNYDYDPFFNGASSDQLSETLLRLTVAGTPAPRLRYELHAVQSVRYSSAAGAGAALPFLQLSAGDVRYRALDLTLDWHREDDHAAALTLDRANVMLTLPRADVTLGRQAITLGKTFLWNPLDVLLPFDPRQFDQDYKPGVDAARVQIPLGPFAGIDLIGVAGRTITLETTLLGDDADADASWTGSALLARAFTTVRGWDVAIQGGKVFGGGHLGAGLSGEIFGVELRGEAALHLNDDGPSLLPDLTPELVRALQAGPILLPRSFADDPPLAPDAVSAVIGIGRRFESTLVIEAEYFHNGAGDADDLEASLLRLGAGGLLAMSEHLLGGVVAYDLLPILVAEALTIVSLDDGSVQVQPRLRWAAADEIEVLAGAIVHAGSRPTTDALGLIRLRSEFGTFPDVFYAEVKWYF